MGIHTFYRMPSSSPHEVLNKEVYLIGRFVGDDWADDDFKKRIDKAVEKLAGRFGWGGFQRYWSPAIVKPYRPLSSKQKYKRAVTKTYNMHKKKVVDILNANMLFVDDLLDGETARLHDRIAVLKNRYNQTKV